jgi:hypothetical protein
MNHMTTRPPAPRPCASCPYRQDVPSGIWSADEYAKLAAYDEPTYAQPARLFLCHQHDHDDQQARICGGWAGCHDGDHLLALRVAVSSGEITAATADEIRHYVSPVPLFASGAEAAAHGMREIHRPGPGACAAINKISRNRADLTEGDAVTEPLPSPRFVVQEFGPRDFAVYDTVTGLSYDSRFTRRGAQEAADRRNTRQGNR